MTREEAIAILQTMEYKLSNQVGSTYCKKKYDAVRVAIKALEQQPCEDAVSRKAVDDLVDELARAISDERCYISRGRSTGEIMQDILDLPSVKPTRKKWKWIEIKNKNGTVIALRCDCCKESPKHAIRSLYCPNCGAEMDIEE